MNKICQSLRFKGERKKPQNSKLNVYINQLDKILLFLFVAANEINIVYIFFSRSIIK